LRILPRQKYHTGNLFFYFTRSVYYNYRDE
jgi:hypothetical protein